MSSKSPKQAKTADNLLLSRSDKNDPNCLHQQKPRHWRTCDKAGAPVLFAYGE